MSDPTGQTSACRNPPEGWRRRWADDGGLLTAELALAITLGLLPVVMVLFSLAQWPARQGAAALAAAEGARAAALADDADEARRAMEQQVRASMAASGITDGNPTAAIDGIFGRGEHIRVTVEIDLPALDLPGLAPLASSRYRIGMVERIDVHRSETGTG